MSMTTLDTQPRLAPPLSGTALASHRARQKRRAKLLAVITVQAARQEPTLTDAAFGEALGVMPGTIHDDLGRLRADGFIAVENKKWSRPGKVPGAGGTMSTCRRFKVHATDQWTAWPQDYLDEVVNRPKKAWVTPPALWSHKKTSLAVPAVVGGEVEEAKSLLRRHARVVVYHLATVEHPDKAFGPSGKAPGDARVVVGTQVYSERQVVQMAAGLMAGGPA